MIDIDSNAKLPIRLFSGPLSMFGAKTQIALLEKGLTHTVTMVPFDGADRYRPKHSEVARVNPTRQVPVLIQGSVEIYDSTQIFEYLEDIESKPALWPASVTDRARARLLEHASDEVYFPHIISLMILEEQPPNTANKEAMAKAIESARSYYLQLDQQLAAANWLAGEYSYADIAFYMAQLFGERKGATMSAATPRLLDWRDRMTDRPAVAEVAGAMGQFLQSKNRPVPAFLQRVV